MTKTGVAASPKSWDVDEVASLIEDLWALRRSMLDQQTRLAPWLGNVAAAHRPSAVNLAHYLAMRQVDLRHLQDRLAWLGVSSLGRAESHVLANVDKVLGILHRIAGLAWLPLSPEEPAGFMRGRELLAQHAKLLFGASPSERDVRIMVTLPSEAAQDERLVETLMAAGMDIARINCAHDGADQWAAMAKSVRRAAKRVGRPVRVLMDLAGPKLRTGPVAAGPAVLRIKPTRDAFGQVTAPGRLGLRPAGSMLPVLGASHCLGVDAEWLGQLMVGSHFNLTDLRAARRRMTVVACQSSGVLVECLRTAYLTADTSLRLHRRGQDVLKTRLYDVPQPPGELRLQRGDLLHLVADGLGHDALPGTKGRPGKPATIACTLPEALARVRKGERIWFDDGPIGGVVRRATAKQVEVDIIEARDGGEHLAADKGINFPDTRLNLPALTAKDLAVVQVAARLADIVGLSFAQSASDVSALRQQLVEQGAGQVGILLKIETRRGFEHLPEMLLAAMAGPAAGVMIARGDLAVECGYERMAEVQEEILWACEAAHMPVVWATQVLETLAKTGLPSRAEITDAAMGGRAECVMLNKGPHILDAMRTLNNILQRMQAHQSKKRTLLRALKAWDVPAAPSGQKPATQSRPLPSEAQPLAD